MSYDLAIWEGARPGDDVEAGVVYDQLFEEYMAGEESRPTPAIAAYTEDLAQRWAGMTDGRTSGWGSLVDCSSGPMIYLTMPYGLARELAAEAARLAAVHGLVCYDPQTECLRPPPAEEDQPGQHESTRGLRHAVDGFLAGETGSEHLPLLAAQALAEGCDTPALRELAGLSRGDVREARELFARAVAELDAAVPGDGAPDSRTVP